jgi:legumain
MLVSLLFNGAYAARHAVLLAGSEGYRNYRHQSDVFQTREILRSRGFPDKNIITFAYNDIPFEKSNPKHGKVFNMKKNVDIYPGAEKIQYKGEQISLKTLRAAMTGDKTYGPALESTDKDDVFFYYNDHGFRGYLCIPGNSGEQLSAKKLREIVQEMIEKKKFKKLFIVIESCYSGSVGKMLDDLPNVYVITASSDGQSSYSHTYDSSLNTFRTNEFTFHYHKYILKNPKKPIEGLYNYTRINTFGSDVHEYGDKTLKKLTLDQFLGEAEPINIEEENAEYYDGRGTVDSMESGREFLEQKIRRSLNYQTRTL